MQKKTKSGKTETVQEKELNIKMPAERISDLHNELVKRNLSGYKAFKFAVHWLEGRFTAVKVIELSNEALVLSTESGYEMHTRYDARKKLLRMSFLNPDEIMSEKGACYETLKFNGLTATIRFYDSSRSENTIDRILHWWFVMLTDYHDAGWPIEEGSVA